MATHTFIATGDSIITRRVSNRTDKAFLDMVELIRGADSAFTNLEIVTPKEPWVPFSEFGGIHLGSPPFILDELKWMGFNLYSAANNPLGGLQLPGADRHHGRPEGAGPGICGRRPDAW